MYPRPLQDRLRIWVEVGETRASFVHAGTFGLLLMVAIISGEPKRFRPLIDLSREAGRRASHSEAKLLVGLLNRDLLSRAMLSDTGDTWDTAGGFGPNHLFGTALVSTAPFLDPRPNAQVRGQSIIFGKLLE